MKLLVNIAHRLGRLSFGLLWPGCWHFFDPGTLGALQQAFQANTRGGDNNMQRQHPSLRKTQHCSRLRAILI